MLKIKNTEVFGLERCVVASGNPMKIGEIDTVEPVTDRDWSRAHTLASAPAGSGHDNFLTGITVIADIQYPQYWSMQLQRYHWVQIVSSESKMHRLIKMMQSGEESFGPMVNYNTITTIKTWVEQYQHMADGEDKDWMFQNILNNLPMGFLLWFTISTNYAQLKTIYKQRRHHRLDEWQDFCDWIETLPHAKELITLDI
jgi:hypothetical protein